jgi:peptidoglycan/LPS O-acetylase OafA/YrhL
MLGAYRFFLALMVVAQHSGGAWGVGAGGFAVFAFFVLSGYLMTHVMHGTYGYTAGGFAKYAVNRLLRIYPLYWLACVLAFAILFFLCDTTIARIAGGMGAPNSPENLLSNILIVVSQKTWPLLIPPAWTLAVELMFYLLIGLGISKTTTATVIWFGFGVIYALTVNVMNMGGDFTYFSPLSASLPFSVGALIFHFRGRAEKLPNVLRSPYACLLLGVLQLLLWLTSRAAGEAVRYEIFLYISIALNALTLAALLRLKPSALFSAKMDAHLGKLSYPIYLTHTAITVLVADLLAFEHQSALLLLIVTPCTIGISLLLAWLVEDPIDRMRNRFKKNSA